MKGKADALHHTKVSDLKHPVVVARAGGIPRFSTYGDALNPVHFLCEHRKVDAFQKRFTDQKFMGNGRFGKIRNAILGPCLILAGTTHRYVGIPLAPILGNTLRKTVDSLGNKQKFKVRSLFHKSPRIGSPPICLIQQKIRRKSGVHQASRRDLIAIFIPLDRQIEIGVFSDLKGVFPMSCINAVNVTVLATRADLLTAVPRIPIIVHLPSKTKKETW